jgi:hypothetical protein
MVELEQVEGTVQVVVVIVSSYCEGRQQRWLPIYIYSVKPYIIYIYAQQYAPSYIYTVYKKEFTFYMRIYTLIDKIPFFKFILMIYSYSNVYKPSEICPFI